MTQYLSIYAIIEAEIPEITELKHTDSVTMYVTCIMLNESGALKIN